MNTFMEFVSKLPEYLQVVILVPLGFVAMIIAAALFKLFFALLLWSSFRDIGVDTSPMQLIAMDRHKERK